MIVTLGLLAGALLLIALKLIIRNKRALQQAAEQQAQEVTKKHALLRLMNNQSKVMKSAKEIAAELNDESKLSK